MPLPKIVLVINRANKIPFMYFIVLWVGNASGKNLIYVQNVNTFMQIEVQWSFSAGMCSLLNPADQEPNH